MADPLLMDLFMDNESVSTINRIISDVVVTLNEDSNRISEYNDFINKDLIGKRDEEDFFEDIIKNYNAKQYRECFKMSRSTVDALIDYLKENCNADCSRMIIPFEKKVHILLYTLGSTYSFRDIGKVFGVNKSSTSIIFREMCTLVTDCRYDLIKWPSLAEQHTISSKVKQFPNCVGFIDSCQFQTKTPGNNPANIHISAKPCDNPEYTLVLQAVCDNSLKFTDIYLGESGTVTNIFQNSPLCNQLEDLVSYENHILGDAKYPLKMNLMTPYKKTSLRSKKNYNKALYAARMVIRRALGRLKAKFRRIIRLDVKKTDTATVIICAACALHNFILLHEPDEEDDIIKEDSQSDLDFSMCVDGLIAARKRNLICDYINQWS